MPTNGFLLFSTPSDEPIRGKQSVEKFLNFNYFKLLTELSVTLTGFSPCPLSVLETGKKVHKFNLVFRYRPFRTFESLFSRTIL